MTPPDIKQIKFTHVPDKPDHRDFIHIPAKEKIKKSVDLRPLFSPPMNQGSLNSCTSFAISAAVEYDLIKQKEPLEGVKDPQNAYIPSPLFIYYNERSSEGDIDKNAPAYMRDGIKSLVKIGVCSNELWPYDESKFTQRPADECYRYAKSRTATKYHKIELELETLKACLSEGFPFVFGFYVPLSFSFGSVAKTGIMENPAQDELRVGGHAVAAVGYEDDKKYFIARNSFSPDWGDKGYFYMPYDFIVGDFLNEGKKEKNTFSFWTIRTML